MRLLLLRRLLLVFQEGESVLFLLWGLLGVLRGRLRLCKVDDVKNVLLRLSLSLLGRGGLKIGGLTELDEHVLE